MTESFINNKLFVYGTLLTNTESEIARFLSKNSRLLGEFQTYGQLYDLGAYPGLTEDASQTNVVSGRLLELVNPSLTLARLDQYEGIVPGREEESEFRRALVQVYQNEQAQTAWVYLYNKPTDGLNPIPYDNYLDYRKDKDPLQHLG